MIASLLLVVALASAAVWAVLIALRGGFWLSSVRDGDAAGPAPAEWPPVIAVVPARNEADVIARAVGSLLAQDYPGRFEVVLVDDSSEDGTAAQAVATAQASGRREQLFVLTGQPLPRGWTGKLWALTQGVEAAGRREPAYFWLSDADIVYAPDTLRSMVTRAEAKMLAAVSLMARLRCESFAEKMLIPAFIFFFQMLYPFGWVNRPESATAAAAGGCVLVRRDALAGIGGIGAIRDALIDDCTLAAHLKRKGGRIWLGLTNRAESIRIYDRFDDIRRMVARSAYAQLGYSPWMLLGTILGMALVYVAPPAIALLGPAPARYVALGTWIAMALAFIPTLRFYKVPWAWGPFLPVIAACYMGFTCDSAFQHMAGRGGLWKGRVQAPRDA